MNVTVDLINASSADIPALTDFQDWVQAAMSALPVQQQACELSIRVIDLEESAHLNETFRLKQGSTNILSFPVDEGLIPEINFLGDLAICAQVVIEEAKQQNKSLIAHWAHMTIHGVLHLNAFDHQKQPDAEMMEQLEITILNTLGYNNPYVQ